MSEDRRAGPSAEELAVKVVDRRRFRPDGEPNEGAPGAEGSPAAAESPPAAPASDAEERLRAQAGRIEELSRAYAALLEDNKAFRARMEREKDRLVEAERGRVAQALLETADELERALAAASATEAPGAVAEGVRLALAALSKRIAELGAERIAVVGKPFDPHVAEALDTVAVADESQDGLVMHEVRAGYRIGDRVLRPARVRVGRLAQA